MGIRWFVISIFIMSLATYFVAIYIGSVLKLLSGEHNSELKGLVISAKAKVGQWFGDFRSPKRHSEDRVSPV
jgi:hypothetical protein